MKTFKDLKFIWFFRSPKVCSKAEVTLNNHKIEGCVNSDDGYEVFIESLPELNKESLSMGQKVNRSKLQKN